MSTPTMFTPVEPGTTFSSRIGGLAKARETGILIALFLVIAITTIKNPAFLFSSDGFRDLLLTPSILVVVAIGEAMVIITRNVDLSVGSILGLSAYLTGRLFIDFPGIPILAVFAIGIIFGALLGLINGALVAFAKVPSLVITLGTLYIYRGINLGMDGERSDRSLGPAAGFSPAGYPDDLGNPGADLDRRGCAGCRRLVHEEHARRPGVLRDRL